MQCSDNLHKLHLMKYTTFKVALSHAPKPSVLNHRLRTRASEHWHTKFHTTFNQHLNLPLPLYEFKYRHTGCYIFHVHTHTHLFGCLVTVRCSLFLSAPSPSSSPLWDPSLNPMMPFWRSLPEKKNTGLYSILKTSKDLQCSTNLPSWDGIKDLY